MISDSIENNGAQAPEAEPPKAKSRPTKKVKPAKKAAGTKKTARKTKPEGSNKAA